MSAQTMADVFAPAEARYRQVVLANTWGHLAPRRNETYRGHIIFAVGCFGDDRLNPTALACEFGELDSSPWFYDALQGFLQDQQTEEGHVYRFDGTFRNYKFTGKIRRLVVA
jgi:hypothetical protein